MSGFEMVMSAFLGVLSIVGPRLIGKYNEILKEKVKNKAMQNMLGEAPRIMGGIVRNVYQGYVKGLKKSREGDGKLQPEEKRTAKRMAIKEFRASVGDAFEEMYESKWGDFDSYVGSLTEKTLINEKNERRVAQSRSNSL